MGSILKGRESLEQSSKNNDFSTFKKTRLCIASPRKKSAFFLINSHSIMRNRTIKNSEKNKMLSHKVFFLLLKKIVTFFFFRQPEKL